MSVFIFSKVYNKLAENYIGDEPDKSHIKPGKSHVIPGDVYVSTNTDDVFTIHIEGCTVFCVGKPDYKGKEYKQNLCNHYKQQLGLIKSELFIFKAMKFIYKAYV